MPDLTLKRASMLRRKAEDACALSPDDPAALDALQAAGEHEMNVYLAGFDRRHPRGKVTVLPPTEAWDTLPPQSKDRHPNNGRSKNNNRQRTRRQRGR